MLGQCLSKTQLAEKITFYSCFRRCTLLLYTRQQLQEHKQIIFLKIFKRYHYNLYFYLTYLWKQTRNLSKDLP